MIRFFKAKKRPEGSVMAAMGIDIAVNARADILVMHDKNFGEALGGPVRHLEYRPESGELIFVTENGMASPLGMPVPEGTRPQMEKAGRAYLLLIRNKKDIAGFAVRPVRQQLSSTANQGG